MPRIAEGRLSFERAGAATVLRAAYAESPLRLLTPRNHGRAAWAYISTLGGGFVDGDRVRLRISVGEGARGFVSTQGPTRIYRSPRGCESETLAEVAAGGGRGGAARAARAESRAAARRAGGVRDGPGWRRGGGAARQRVGARPAASASCPPRSDPGAARGRPLGAPRLKGVAACT